MRWLTYIGGLACWAGFAWLLFRMGVVDHDWPALGLTAAVAILLGAPAVRGGMDWPRLGLESLLTAAIIPELIRQYREHGLNSVLVDAAMVGALVVLIVYLAGRFLGPARRSSRPS